jgi:hypothetical protein
MGGGIIKARKGIGDVYFMNKDGKEVMNASRGVEVTLEEEFSGFSVRDAIEEAKKYAIGAIQKKVAQKLRGFDCLPVVKDVKINYKIKYGFAQNSEEQENTDRKADAKIAKKFTSAKKISK